MELLKLRRFFCGSVYISKKVISYAYNTYNDGSHNYNMSKISMAKTMLLCPFY